MRIYRKQKTLWRIGLFPLLDVLILSFAALHFSGVSAPSGSATTAFTLKQQGEIANQGVPVTITVEQDGTVYLDGIPTDTPDLEPSLSDALRISGGGHVTIEPAPGATINVINAAVTAARAAGAKSLSLVAQNTGLPN